MDRKRLDRETVRFREMYKDIQTKEPDQLMIDSLLAFIQELINNHPETWEKPYTHPLPWAQRF